MNDVIILAGGLGTRLAHTVTDTQKTMAPVGGRPFLHYLVSSLAAKGARRIVLAVSYRREQITAYFGDSFRGARILYSVEEEPLGTGGAIRNALSVCETENVFVFNGDTYFEADTDELLKKHLESGAAVTLAARRLCDIDRSGTLVFDADGRITSFRERQKLAEGYINGGVYCIKKSLADELPQGRFSFEKDVLEALTVPVFCTVSDGYFIDIGVPGDYFRAHTEVPPRFGENVYAAAFLDRDGVICKEKHHLYKKEDFEFIPGVPEALERLREHGYLLVVITNQAGVAKGYYSERDVTDLLDHMCGLLDGVTCFDALYYCPYHPEGRVPEYTLDSRDRKPAPGMIERAVRDFAEKGIKIDLSSSVLVGDTENDILTGINAGVGKTVLVRSGHPIPDEAGSLADAICDSLASAVSDGTCFF